MFAASKSPAGNNYGPADPQFDYVTLLLNGDGTNGAQNNTFLDSSSNAFTITRNGNTTQGSFSPYGSLWSNYFNGSSDFLTTASSSSFAFGTGNFTLEAWVYPTASQTDNWIIGLYANCWLRVGSTGALQFFDSVASSSVTASSALPLNTWTHVVAVRNGTTLTLYQNGSSVASGTVSSNFSTSVPCSIGGVTGFARYWNGYISNARVTNTAVYTGAFTPSTTPLTAISGTQLLTCQSNRFIDTSSNALALTINGTPSVQRFSPFNPTVPYSTATIGGSGYFDGSGDYLSISNSSNLNFSGQFNWETWVYFNSISGSSDNILYTKLVVAGLIGLEIGVNTSGNLYAWFNGSIVITGSSTVKANQWVHLAVSRDGSNNVRVFVNGTSDATAVSNSDDLSSIGNSYICSNYNGSARITGYVTDTRLIKGSALYTSNFTVPTAPLTAVSNTQLLCNMTNAGIPDSAMMNDLETVGNAQVSTSVKKFGTGSLSFNGTTDYLNSQQIAPAQFGTGDFTVECWFYSSNITGGRVLIDTRTGENNNGAQFGVADGNTPFMSNASGGILNGSYSYTTNTWYHYAVCRQNGNLYMWINGQNAGTATGNTTNFSDGKFTVGAHAGGTGYFSGYIDDVRITKGYARYTSSFTPPTAALPTY